jgi:regulatory protein
MPPITSTKKPASIRLVALNYLARRDYARAELAQKLLAKKFPTNEIEALLNELTQNNSLNDLRFAENYCRYRRTKGYGPLRIAMELQARGIAAEVIAEVVQITDNAWLIEAQNTWRKRFKAKAATDFSLLAKQMRFLQYRGFTREQIDYAVGKL